MEIPRKIGICIVMIIPSFVGGGAVWELFGSWFAVSLWVVIMGLFCVKILWGKSIPMSGLVAIITWIIIMGVLCSRILKSNFISIFG